MGLRQNHHADTGKQEEDHEVWERASNFQFQKAQPRNQKDQEPSAVVSLRLTKENSCCLFLQKMWDVGPFSSPAQMGDAAHSEGVGDWSRGVTPD